MLARTTMSLVLAPRANLARSVSPGLRLSTSAQFVRFASTMRAVVVHETGDASALTVEKEYAVPKIGE